MTAAVQDQLCFVSRFFSFKSVCCLILTNIDQSKTNKKGEQTTEGKLITNSKLSLVQREEKQEVVFLRSRLC